MKITELTELEFNKLTDLYTDQQIGQQLNEGKSRVGYYRRKLGVKSYGEKNNLVVGVKGVSNSTNRKHQFNERFFQTIDSEIKAYALGLIMADGHITKSLHRVKIALTEADSYLLNQIAEAAEFSGKLLVGKPREGNYQKHDMIILNFNSTVLAQDLIALGLTTTKDTNLCLPCIAPELERHLIRGIVDGDGTILKSEELLCLSGRKELLEDIVTCLNRHGFDRVGNISPDKSIYRLRMGQYAMPVLDWFYGCNPSIVLKRKLRLYQIRKQFLQAWDSKY